MKAKPRVLICGDRGWRDYQKIYDALKKLMPVALVIEGEAQGADRLGRAAAEQLGVPVLKFPADWTRYGRAAGSIRNEQQLREGQPTYWLAFHPDLENSKGTGDMVRRLRKAGIPGEVIV